MSGGAVWSGKTRRASKQGNVADRGKYLVIWNRDGATWKLHRDIWNTSMPAA